MKQVFSFACAAFLLGMMSTAGAATHYLSSTIDGAQAGTGSGATGSATATYDDVSGEFSWNIQWTPLDGNISVAHFHGPAMPGQSAGVQVNFGSISGLTSPSIGSATIDGTQAADLLADLWYINIHSSIAPGGEIRGQVELLDPAIYDYAGVATLCSGTCDSFASLSGPPMPSTIEGSIVIDAGASDTWGPDDALDFNFLVMSPESPLEPFDGTNPTTANPLPVNANIAVVEPQNTAGTFVTGGTTDGNGVVNGGTILFRFTVPPFSSNSAWVIFDLNTGQAQVCLFFDTAGCIPDATQSVVFEIDSDGDGVPDITDNCTDVANPAQIDADGDGHGNRCDADFNQSCGIVNFPDLAVMQSGFFTLDPVLDLNGSGGPVNFADLSIMQELFFAPPGPSAPGALCN